MNGSSPSDVEALREHRRAIANPYRAKIHNFPGKLLPFHSAESDISHVRTVLQSEREAFVEIGSGSGGHLIEQAALNPEGIYFGIELRFKRAVRTLEKAELRGLTNLYVLRCTAKMLQEIFPESSLSGLYMNFPEPWERERHRKHRLNTEHFLNQISRVLKPGAFFSIKTDHESFFSDALSELASDDNYELVMQTRDLYASEFLPGNIVTEFEKLFLSQGKAIHKLVFRKK